MVAINEARADAGLLTYVVDRFTQTEAYGLARFHVSILEPFRLLGWSDARDVAVRDVPGAVQATYRVGDTRVAIEIAPLLRGAREGAWEGAAVYSVRADPPWPLAVVVGPGRVVGPASPRAAWLQADLSPAELDNVLYDGALAIERSPRHPLVVAIRRVGDPSDPSGSPLMGRGKLPSFQFPKGRGRIVVAYARDEARARALASDDPMKARREVSKYYERMLRARIRTPEPDLDAAFRSALTTLEYNWIAPLGWNECIHHWYSLWHMQHSPAAEWIGQVDRSRACILTHSDRLMSNGAAPQLSVDGRRRRDFGGSNQFYAWQIAHYWRFTADRGAARILAPTLDRLIRQTWEEYDPDGDGLLAWGQQIGNQEDYISTPWNGATPTIEGIQMLLTRAELADALGERQRASECRRRAEALRRRLIETLWMPDLGRFAFSEDPLGVKRLDGQYHTFAYPAIYGIVDALDAWTSVRHMRDRLTGSGGEVYCSNSFPWHAVGTWGMQAGAAQQPWAALAMARVGLRNEAYRPLLAAARWAMNADHRGSWPEISVEPTPAYFSPPAGLFVQAVVEGIFGLELNRPARVISISPSLPDRWPSASLSLPGFRAAFSRDGDTLTYDLTTEEPMRRRLDWLLPCGRVLGVKLNGRPLAYRVFPGVACVRLTAHTAACLTSRFAIRMAPSTVRLSTPASVAEGDWVSVVVRGATIERVDDRGGVLASWRLGGPARSVAKTRAGLLAPHAGYGRLGLMNFARRTFFLHVRDERGARWIEPATVALLPPYEAAGSIVAGGDGGVLRITVRNNTARAISGAADIRLGKLVLRASVAVQARSQRLVEARIGPGQLAALCSGDNDAMVTLPTGDRLCVTLDAGAVLAAHAELRSWLRGRMQAVALPEDALEPDVRWRQWRTWHAYGHWPWAFSRPPLEAFEGRDEVRVPGIEDVPFQLAGRKLAPLSLRSGKGSLTLDLGSSLCRKLYLLVTPLLDNHDTFSAAARVTVRLTNGALLTRVLRFPGDVDWWCPKEVVGQFATASGARGDRLGILPLLGRGTGDWPLARPPGFPQPAFWARCRVFATASAVHNVVEVDLGEPRQVTALTVEALGADGAPGIVAATAELATGHAALRGTRWFPPPGLRESQPLFRLCSPRELEGWQLEGDTFSIAAVPGLFSRPTLNSLAARGESATGRALSPTFAVDGGRLRFRLHGGNTSHSGGGPDLAVRLLDARTGQVLAALDGPGTHVLQDAAMDVAHLQGREVRLELLDRNSNPSFAWIGICEVASEGG